jgi:hypothetical protein
MYLRRETHMSRKMLGFAAVVGTALGAWWWTAQRRARANSAGLTPTREHGTVIFHNTPTATDVDAIV